MSPIRRCLFDSLSLSLSVYYDKYIFPCRFRRAPHRWLSTFCMPINHHVSSSSSSSSTRWQRLMHRQKVSYRTPIVSISRSSASPFGACLYWRSLFPLSLSRARALSLSPLASRRPFFSLPTADPSSSTFTAAAPPPPHHCHCSSYDD